MAAWPKVCPFEDGDDDHHDDAAVLGCLSVSCFMGNSE
jgi:hypothetical protein